MLYFRRCAYTLSAHSNVFLRKVGPVVMGRVVMDPVVMDPVVRDCAIITVTTMELDVRFLSERFCEYSQEEI